jgi:DNA-binding response OmpR family regulator
VKLSHKAKKYGGISTMTVLVIDDEQMILTLVSKVLGLAGHQVIAAESGEEGLELLVTHRDGIDLAIIDYHLNGISGVETLRQMREMGSLIPCLISSGQLFPENCVPSHLRRGVKLLQKPYRPTHLLDQVHDGLLTPASI